MNKQDRIEALAKEIYDKSLMVLTPFECKDAATIAVEFMEKEYAKLVLAAEGCCVKLRMEGFWVAESDLRKALNNLNGGK